MSINIYQKEGIYFHLFLQEIYFDFFLTFEEYLYLCNILDLCIIYSFITDR